MTLSYTLFVLFLLDLANSLSCPNDCDQCNINGCTTCPITRQLSSTNLQCDCITSYYETNHSQCQACQNPYCYECSILDSTKCLDCGNSSITHRILVNNNCICQVGFINVAWSYNCQNTKFDIRMLRFESNMIQQERIINLKNYVSNSTNQASLVSQLHQNALVTTYNNSICHLPDQTDEALQVSCPQGEIYQRLDQNIFGAAYLNQNQDPSTNWYTNFSAFGLSIVQKFIYQRNLTLTYNIIGFQIANKTKDAPLVLQCLIVEVLNVSFTDRSQRLLVTSNTVQPYMQYIFNMGYNRNSLFNEVELQDVIDLLMALINGCMDFCDSCSIFRNSIICNKCSGLREFVDGSCQCVASQALADQCQLNCIPGCQQCIQDCYSCQNVSLNNYSNCQLTIQFSDNTNNSTLTINNTSIASNTTNQDNTTQNLSNLNNTALNSSNLNATTLIPKASVNQNFTTQNQSTPNNTTQLNTTQLNTTIPQNQSLPPNNTTQLNTTIPTTQNQSSLPNNTTQLDTTIPTTQVSTTLNATILNDSMPNDTSQNSQTPDTIRPIAQTSTTSNITTQDSSTPNSTIIPIAQNTITEMNMTQIPTVTSVDQINTSTNETSLGSPTLIQSTSINSSGSNVTQNPLNISPGQSSLPSTIALIPNSVVVKNSSNQTSVKSSPPASLTPLYAAIGSVAAAIMIGAPIAYLLMMKQLASRFIAERAIDSLGVLWPHKKFSLPTGRDISQWESAIPNDIIERAFSHNGNYQNMHHSSMQQQTFHSINQ